jgi:SecDF, P1 head subdomain
MKTLKYIILGVLLSSLVFSSFAFNHSNKNITQAETVTFSETYTQTELFSKLDPKDTFFSLVNTEKTDPGSSRVGRCFVDTLEYLMKYIKSEAFRSQVPKDLIIAAGAQVNDQMISLYAIRKSPSGHVLPSGSDLEEISVSLSKDEENYMLLFSFSESGSEKWASMTRLNTGKDIAILSQGKVLAAPRLVEEIKNGKCAISGNYTEDDVNKLKAAFEN